MIASKRGPSTPSRTTTIRLPLRTTVARRPPRGLTEYGLNCRAPSGSRTGPTTFSSTGTAAEVAATDNPAVAKKARQMTHGVFIGVECGSEQAGKSRQVEETDERPVSAQQAVS